MTSSFEIMKSCELNLRNIFVTIIIVGAVTGGNLWLHSSDPPLGYGKYEKYSLSFEYPLLFNVIEVGFTGPGTDATDFSGVAQVQGVWDNVFHNYLVIWTTEPTEPELAESLESNWEVR